MSRAWSIRTLRGTATVALALALLVPSGPAAAHTDLESSSPAEGEIRQGPPEEITLTFSEPVSVDLAVIALTSGDGEPERLAPEQIDPTTIGVAPGDAERFGSWTVAYRVVSDDGHPITGTVEFNVRDAGESSSTTVGPSSATSPSDASSPANGTPGGQSDRETSNDPPSRTVSTVVIGLITLGGVVLTMWLIARAGRRPQP